MPKTIIVGGFGPGIATAVAELFGSQGFSVALVARTAERLAGGVQALRAKGIQAEAFVADLSSPTAVQELIGQVRQQLGPIQVLHWNAYPTGAGNLLDADVVAMRAVFDVAVTALVVAVQEALPDLKQGQGAVLVTNGQLLFDDPNINLAAVNRSLMGLGLGNAAKHKVVGMLAGKLKPEGVYVGEVIVTATVKGSAFDTGQGTLEPATVARKFWDLYTTRGETSIRV